MKVINAYLGFQDIDSIDDFSLGLLNTDKVLKILRGHTITFSREVVNDLILSNYLPLV